MGCCSESRRGDWAQALRLMESALEMLDASGAPGDAASHLDLAIARLESVIGPVGVGDPHHLRRQIEEALALGGIGLEPRGVPIWDKHS